MSETRLKHFAAYGPAFVVVVALLILWEAWVRLGGVDATLLPAPTSILEALANKWDVLLGHSIQTMLETVLGLVIATLLGVVLAVAIDLSSWLRRALYPLLVASQTIPMVALAPLLLVWFGFDILPKVILVVLYCFFPITVACADGLLGVDADLVRLMRSMRASRWQILWLVRLPGAMPSFFSGLRIAATYSVTGAIIGEYVGAEQGLGIYMQTSANAHAIVLVFTAIVVTVILSLALFGLVGLMERILLPWQVSRQARAVGSSLLMENRRA